MSQKYIDEILRNFKRIYENERFFFLNSIFVTWKIYPICQAQKLLAVHLKELALISITISKSTLMYLFYTLVNTSVTKIIFKPDR